MSKNIVYFGSDAYSCRILEAVRAAGIPISLVVTTPAQPKGRGLTVQKNEIEQYCADEGLPVISPATLRDDAVVETLRDQNVDLFVVVSYGKILTDAVLEIPTSMTINVHPSLLPRWRGPSPMQSALLHGDSETGVSIIKVVQKVDAGDIVMQKRMLLDVSVGEASLAETLADIGAELLVASIDAIRNGTHTMTPQDESAVTYARKLTKEDGEIKWEETTKTTHDRIRALCAWPTAHTLFRGKRLRIFASQISDRCPAEATPGDIVAVEKNGSVYVATGDGVLAVAEVQLEGKKRMPAFAFALGVHLKAGDTLGE